MSLHQFIINDSFWKFLVSLEEMTEKKDKSIFCSTLNIDESTLQDFIQVLSQMDVSCTSDQQFIYPLKEKCKIKMEFSLVEWFALQVSFGNKETPQIGHYYHKIIQDKVAVAQNALENFNLFKKPESVKVHLLDLDNLEKRIDYDIANLRAIKLHFFNTNECVIFPHRLVFLDGVLCVVGESLSDKVLLFFGIEDIQSIEDFKVDYSPNLSQIEVNEFICHLRLINSKEERLVLKVYNQLEADLLPNHHYLGNPFVTSNTEGDMIWAATIEMCDDIFQWLHSMKDRVEILDPGHIRKEFSHFCELKKENSGNKKAS